MNETLLILLAVLSLGQFAVLLILFLRRPPSGPDMESPLKSLGQQNERMERGLRDEFARTREEQGKSGRDLREEVATAMNRITQTLETKMNQIQESNTRKLEEMRHTVDEKLQGTLEKRLGESFKLVSDRLEQVHKGLGEMQSLASGVGDLKRVLTNVKTRGTWGEIQLRAILEQILLPSQYEANVKVKPDSNELVEFAIRLPGGEAEDKPVWLPIDSKFPKEDYERILEAQDRADSEALRVARDGLAKSLKLFAKDIREQYISPPLSTDFGILFLPTEGLFAEICQYPGLLDAIQRDHRVTVAGPTTMATLLNSLHMGFQTLAIQERSSEVWQVLGAVKTEFGKFGLMLEGVEKKLDEAKNKIAGVRSKTTTITRKLKKVEELPSESSRMLLDLVDGEEDGEDAEA
ncbi:MAG: DNA recombination protein RmuC [Bdellovibrionaceae bacterium]|nr:DNA recombination protein RmuC [Pseudobdellovibrionaceae bacterium]MBX3034018.1 DNA recombination protein RmuC [Pseudobdellovibrionaceae bacterium]